MGGVAVKGSGVPDAPKTEAALLGLAQTAFRKQWTRPVDRVQ